MHPNEVPLVTRPDGNEPSLYTENFLPLGLETAKLGPLHIDALYAQVARQEDELNRSAEANG